MKEVKKFIIVLWNCFEAMDFFLRTENKKVTKQKLGNAETETKNRMLFYPAL